MVSVVVPLKNQSAGYEDLALTQDADGWRGQVRRGTGQTMVTKVNPRTVVCPGDQIGLKPDTDRVHRFDPQGMVVVG